MNGRARTGWIAGLVVGAAGGFLALEFPTLGWLILVLFAILAVISGPRAAAIGGLGTGIGAGWLVLFGRVAVTCHEEPGCQAQGIETWVAVGAGTLAIGLALTLVAYVHAFRRRRTL